MKTVNLDKKFAAAIIALILISTAIGALMVQQYFPQIGSIKAEGMEDPLEAWSEASYIIWQYNSTFYACRNMSTWEVEPLDSNKTYVEQMAIGNLTGSSGTVYLKEVTHNYSVTVPANVSVIESVGGVARRFINIANSRGSPYTISVDSGYYLGQDSLLNYISSWSSTNARILINNVFGSITAAPPQKIVVLKGNFTLDGALTVGSYTYVDATQAVLIMGVGVSSDTVQFASGATMSEWHGGLIVGNGG
jgi:hypothetical protein